MRAILLAAALSLPSLAAHAHAFLKSASPAVGSTLAAPPAQVLITFTEGVEPAFSTIIVTDPTGTDVTDGKPSRDGDPARLAMKLKPLMPGAYTVVWHAVSVDTHKTDGRFTFTVQPDRGR